MLLLPAVQLLATGVASWASTGAIPRTTSQPARIAEITRVFACNLNPTSPATANLTRILLSILRTRRSLTRK